jgi:1,4-alpha-glucan branching enzyme
MRCIATRTPGRRARCATWRRWGRSRRPHHREYVEPRSGPNALGPLSRPGAMLSDAMYVLGDAATTILRRARYARYTGPRLAAGGAAGRAGRARVPGRRRLLAELALRHPDGLWECQLALRTPVNYRLEVQWHGGTQGLYADAYACPPLIGDTDLHFLGGRRHALAAFRGAWRARVRSAPVPACASRCGHPTRGTSAWWATSMPGTGAATRCARAAAAACGSCSCRMRPGRSLQVRDHPATAARAAAQGRPVCARRRTATRHRQRGGAACRRAGAARARAAANAAPGADIDLRGAPGSWRRHPDGRFHSWDELAARIARLRRQPGLHPHRAAAGHRAPVRRLLGLPDPRPVRAHARFGPPDGLARFVEACHARGIGVLLDWVPAHFPSDAHGLARFDGRRCTNTPTRAKASTATGTR